MVKKKMRLMISSIFKTHHHHPLRPHWPSCNPKTLSFRAADQNLVFECSEEAVETVVRGVVRSSERMFFEPGRTKNILEEAKGGGFLFKESVVMAMESEDPYGDFRRSMEEMVRCCDELKDWECLEELLRWYLKVNGKKNHGFIVGAFVDLLLGLASSSSSSSTCCSDDDVSFSSAVSSLSSSSSPMDEDEEK